MSDSESMEHTAERAESESEALLTATEARVLGCLMEKQLTTPGIYPLTLNSLVTACNQKTSREPVMSLHSGEVQRCINGLRERELVQLDYGSRADKYSQRLTRKLGFDDAEQSLFALMLLRGPQTFNELFSRSQRMFAFDSIASLKNLLEALLSKSQCWVVKLPRHPGQREDRYMHLLCGALDVNAYATPVAKIQTIANDDLRDRVEKLEKQVAWLVEKLGGDVELPAVD